MSYRTPWTENQDLVKAATAAFALISVSDGEIAVSEANRIQEWLESQFALPALLDAMRDADDLLAVLARDYEQGFAEVMRRLTVVRNEPDRDIVVQAAQAAIVADEHLDEAEESMLRTICQKLGVDPSAA
jgi:tellurite resistance protein